MKQVKFLEKLEADAIPIHSFNVPDDSGDGLWNVSGGLKVVSLPDKTIFAEENVEVFQFVTTKKLR